MCMNILVKIVLVELISLMFYFEMLSLLPLAVTNLKLRCCQQIWSYAIHVGESYVLIFKNLFD